jgi:hypothetical protein
MSVRLISIKSFAIYFLSVFVFSSAIGITHFSPYQDPAGLPWSNNSDHHPTYALQPEDNDSEPDNGDEFAKLPVARDFIQCPVCDWHLHTKTTYFVTGLGKNPLPPRSPPVT